MNISNIYDWRRQIARLEGAYASSTIRAYHADIESFVCWCEVERLEAFPVSEDALCRYIEDQGKSHASSTVNRRLYSLRRVLKLMSLDDVTRSQEVRLTHRRVLRAKLARPKQAKGMTRDYLDQFLALQPNSLIGLRNRAMLSLGYEGLTRRSELVVIRDEDIEHLADGSLRVLIRRSKADPFGQGRLIYTSVSTGKLIAEWIEQRGEGFPFLFCPVYKNKPIKRSITVSALKRLLYAGNDKLGVKGETFSGHSMRVGAAQDLLARGFDVAAIMRAGGWKSINTLVRYLEKSPQRIWR